MSEVKFMTMRHIETVRNALNEVIREMTRRQDKHDQSKLQSPEAEYFEEYTLDLRELDYMSAEYKESMEAMRPVLDHHYANNRHHPEYHDNGIEDMDLITVMEMFLDWWAATQRHDSGDIYESIEQNQERFGYSDDLKQIFINAADFIEEQDIPHHAGES